METAPNNTTVSLKSKKAILTTLHYQYSDWKRLLGFYAGELKLLEKRAGEYETEAPNENNSTTEMEHFYNQFGMLNRKIELLKHDIQKGEETIQKLVYEHACHIKRHLLETDNFKLNQVKDISGSLTALQFSFNQFLSKNI